MRVRIFIDNRTRFDILSESTQIFGVLECAMAHGTIEDFEIFDGDDDGEDALPFGLEEVAQ